MSRIWIKLYLETLDDPKMGRLPDSLWRRCVELFLLAGRVDRDGLLPTVAEMAWVLRTDETNVLSSLHELEKCGIVSNSGEGWIVVAFKKRQYSESYERVKRYRNGKSNAEGNGVVAEKWSTSTSTSDSNSDSMEGGGMGEGTRYPTTPKEARKHPEIQLYQRITKGFPGDNNYRIIIDTIQYLHEKHGEKLEEYLMPFWSAWSTRRTSNGKPYSPGSMVWLSEWAMSGDIPRANGHEPSKGGMKDVIRKVAQNAKHN